MLRRSLAGLALALTLAAVTASAASVSVNPTRLVIPPGAVSAVLTLRNESTEEMRFQVSSFEWTNSPAGEMVLRPTDRMLAFPALMVIEPKGTRKIRIAVPGGAGPQELSYRLVLAQLPSRAGHDLSAGVSLLTQFNVPPFVQPRDRRVTAAVDPVRLSGGRAQVVVHNRGPVHLTPQQFQLAAFDAAGAALWTKALPAWYLLAGEDRFLGVDVAPGVCPARLVATLRFQELAAPLVEATPLPPGACSR
jgi:fimbrial chaperone protein